MNAMYGNSYGGYGSIPLQQQYQSPAAQRAYQQLNAISAAGYPQMYSAPAPSQPMNQGLTWVQGDSAARSFLVAPGSTVLLMDSDANRFYIKSADASGMPAMRTFEYSEILPDSAAKPAPTQSIDPEMYVTRQEYEDMAQKFNDLAERLNKLLVNDTKRRKVVPENEEPVV